MQRQPLRRAQWGVEGLCRWGNAGVLGVKGSARGSFHHLHVGRMGLIIAFDHDLHNQASCCTLRFSTLFFLFS